MSIVVPQKPALGKPWVFHPRFLKGVMGDPQSLSTHVTDVIRRVHLNLEAVQIIKLKRFLRIATIEILS
jgi:hypothetical protein